MVGLCTCVYLLREMGLARRLLFFRCELVVIDEQRKQQLPSSKIARECGRTRQFCGTKKNRTTSYTASMSSDSRWTLATRKDQGEKMKRGERKSTSSEDFSVLIPVTCHRCWERQRAFIVTIEKRGRRAFASEHLTAVRRVWWWWDRWWRRGVRSSHSIAH